MSSYPLFFTFKHVIQGDDFRAIIEAKGKALMVNEDDKWWIYGVKPGGTAAHGASLTEGLSNFHTTFKNVLLDIASESQSAYRFKLEARDFFDSVDEEELKTWETARNKLRSEKIACPKDIDALKRETSDPDCSIDIILVRKTKRPGIKKKDIISDDDQYQCAA